MANAFVNIELNTTDVTKVVKGVPDVMRMGWMSIVEDPTGAILGLWKTRR